jgi:hypothetical protein
MGPSVPERLTWFDMTNPSSLPVNGNSSVVFDLINRVPAAIFNGITSNNAVALNNNRLNITRQYLLTQNVYAPILISTTSISLFLWVFPTQGTGGLLTELGQYANYDENPPQSGTTWVDTQLGLLNGTLIGRVWNCEWARSVSTVSLNMWHYLGLVYDAFSGITYVYIDGQLAGNTTLTCNRVVPYNTPPFNGSLYYAVGASSFTNLGTPLYGAISFGSLEVFPVALSAPLVSLFYNTSSYRFQEPRGELPFGVYACRLGFYSAQSGQSACLSCPSGALFEYLFALIR